MTITPPRSLIVCDICNASWQGAEGDGCYWCNKRYEQNRDSERRRLLFPEWMGWSDRYFACSEIDRAVWAHTRGFVGDYRGKWEDALYDATEMGIVTGDECDAAIGRYERWMTHMRNSASA